MELSGTAGDSDASAPESTEPQYSAASRQFENAALASVPVESRTHLLSESLLGLHSGFVALERALEFLGKTSICMIRAMEDLYLRAESETVYNNFIKRLRASLEVEIAQLFPRFPGESDLSLIGRRSEQTGLMNRFFHAAATYKSRALRQRRVAASRGRLDQAPPSSIAGRLKELASDAGPEVLVAASSQGRGVAGSASASSFYARREASGGASRRRGGPALHVAQGRRAAQRVKPRTGLASLADSSGSFGAAAVRVSDEMIARPRASLTRRWLSMPSRRRHHPPPLPAAAAAAATCAGERCAPTFRAVRRGGRHRGCLRRTTRRATGLRCRRCRCAGWRGARSGCRAAAQQRVRCERRQGCPLSTPPQPAHSQTPCDPPLPQGRPTAQRPVACTSMAVAPLAAPSRLARLLVPLATLRTSATRPTPPSPTTPSWPSTSGRTRLWSRQPRGTLAPLLRARCRVSPNVPLVVPTLHQRQLLQALARPSRGSPACAAPRVPKTCSRASASPCV